MNEKMTLLYSNDTKAVLAAVTRIGMPAAASDQKADSRTQEVKDADEVTALVGSDLVIRFQGPARVKGTDDQIKIPAASLRVLTGQFDSSVLATPRDFYIDAKLPKPATLLPAANIALTTTKISVTLPAGPSITLWARVGEAGSSDGQTLIPTITPTGAAIDLAIQTLVTGRDYVVVVIAAGYKPVTKLFPNLT